MERVTSWTSNLQCTDQTPKELLYTVLRCGQEPITYQSPKLDDLLIYNIYVAEGDTVGPT